MLIAMVKKVHASHILLKTQKDASIAYYDITHGGNFEDIAKVRSLCSSGRKGGNLGWFGRGQMVKAFENKAFSMKKGDVSPPVKTQFGWHIIRVNNLK